MDKQDYNGMNEKLKQTAVDWLYEILTTENWKYKTYEEQNEIFQKAKQMEKEQMIDAYVTGRMKDKNIKYGIKYYNTLEDFIDAGEEYYNETYEQ